MAANNKDEEDPFLELLDVEANELDDKELEELMSPQERLRRKIEEQEKTRKEKEQLKAKLKEHKANQENGEAEGGENEEEEEEEEVDEGKMVSLFEVRITKATDWKNLGNEEFKKGNYKAALKQYQGSLIFLRGIENHILAGDVWASGNKNPHELKKDMDRGCHPTPEQLQQWKKLKIDAHNNMISCLFKEKEEIDIESVEEEEKRWQKILKYCEEVLEIDADNVKGLFKKGKVLFMMEKYDDAYELFRKAEVFSRGPADRQLSQYIKRCESLLSKHYKEMMGMFKGVFDKMAVAEDHQKDDYHMGYGADEEDIEMIDAGANDEELEKMGLSSTTPRKRDVPYHILDDQNNEKI